MFWSQTSCLRETASLTRFEMPTDTETLAVVHRFNDAFNRHDVDGIMR